MGGNDQLICVSLSKQMLIVDYDNIFMLICRDNAKNFFSAA